VGSYQIHSAGDLNGDGFGDAVVVLPGTGYYLYSGASHLPTTFASTSANTTASDAAGDFDLDGDGVPDFAVGTSGQAPLLYRGTAAGPALVSNGLSHVTASAIIGFSDNDGDGRPDIVGTSGQTSAPSLQWAGSDGTTNPRVVYLQPPTSVAFNGLIVK
jgi:FG-GAP-like repeat